jgi:rare lipoprotein A
MGELPNSHDRTLTDKSYVLHGIPYNKSVIVTVNDRCREHEESFIDLSREAAHQIGMISQGKANVRIIIVENENPPDEDVNTEKK